MELTIRAKIRDILRKKVKQLRKQGIIPGELYGHNVSNKHIAVDKKEFLKVYKEAGENTIVHLELEDKKIPTLIADVGHNYLTGEIESVDFYEVKMGEKIEVEIPIELKGESPAARKGFIIVKTLNEIKVSANPSSIPHSFEVDISVLEDLGDKIVVKDIKAPKDVKILVPSETVIAAVVESVKEEAPEVASSPETTTLSSEAEDKTAEDKTTESK